MGRRSEREVLRFRRRVVRRNVHPTGSAVAEAVRSHVLHRVLRVNAAELRRRRVHQSKTRVLEQRAALRQCQRPNWCDGPRPQAYARGGSRDAEAILQLPLDELQLERHGGGIFVRDDAVVPLQCRRRRRRGAGGACGADRAAAINLDRARPS